MKHRRIYLVGSLRNDQIPIIANRLRECGHYVFDDWFAAGPEADDYWQEYEKQRGHTFAEALNGAHARDVFEFDRNNLHDVDTTILVMPCGRSGHIELGYQLGRGVEGHILLPGEPDRFDVMYRFADGVWTSLDDLIVAFEKEEAGNLR